MASLLRKHRARELAMQAVFLWDANNATDLDLARSAMTTGAGLADLSSEPIDFSQTPDEETVNAAMSMAIGAWENRQLSDDWITRLAPQWPPRRQPAVDRNILRLAVWEMTHTQTPPKVVIDEAIELAKRYSTENSPSFVNGVLDAVLKEVVALKEEGTKARRQEGTQG